MPEVNPRPEENPVAKDAQREHEADAEKQEEQTIEQMADTNGGGPLDGDPDEPVFALDGDRQLTLAGLGGRGAARNVAIEAEVSLMSASVPCRGLIDPDKQGQLLVSYVPAGYRYVPVREGEKIVKWKLRMYLRPMYVEEFVDAEASDVEPAEK